MFEKCDKEEREYRALPDSVREKYDLLMELGDRAYKTGKFVLAEEKYREASDISMLSISDYYVGKALFKQGKLQKAKEYFSNYALNGGSKYCKCLLHLGSIYDSFDKKSLMKKQIRLMERLSNSFEKELMYKGPGSSYAAQKMF